MKFINQCQQHSSELSSPAGERREAHWASLQGQAQINRGQQVEGGESLERSAALLGRPIPQSTWKLIPAILKMALEQVWHRWLGPRLTADREQRETLLEVATVYERLFAVYLLANDPLRLFYASLRAVNLGENAGIDSGTLARSYTNLAPVLGSFPMVKQADYYGGKAIDTAERVGVPSVKGWALFATAFFDAGRGRWAIAEEKTDESRRLSSLIGDRRRWEEASASQAMAWFIQGRFDGSERSLARKVYLSGLNREDPQGQGWGLCVHSLNLHVLG